MRTNGDSAGIMINDKLTTFFAAFGAAASLTTAAMAADLSYKDAPVEYASRTWIITLGGYAVAAPEYEGSDEYELGFKPIFNIRKSGSREWLSLPDDKGGFALYETSNFRMGPAFGFQAERSRHDVDFFPGAERVDWTFEAGAFAELWLTDSLRTRVDVVHGIGGHEGLVANFSADAVVKRDRWTFTVGPRFEVVSDEYADTYFSTAGYEAEGGFHSVGGGASISYQWTDRIALKLYGEYDHLLNDAADSPLVDDIGSEDQFTIGVGASYTFEYSR